MRIAGEPQRIKRMMKNLSSSGKTRSRLLLMLAVALAVGAFFAFGLQRYLTLEALKTQKAAVESWRDAHPALAMPLYALLYIVVTGLSLPGAAVMTLAGGALFGLGWGVVLVSFASSIGATLAFLASRFLFREGVKTRYGQAVARVDEGIAREGAFYLFTLRLIPAIPFFLVNLAMGLTAIRTFTYYWVSQLGMFPATCVFVNAGTQLAGIESPADALSPGLLFSFALLGLFPLLAKRLAEWTRARRVYARWTEPSRFDRNLIVIGAGSAGLVASYIAAAAKAKTTLIEKRRMGGDCLNTGCVPSKALIASAKLAARIRRAQEFGLGASEPKIDFAQVMERVRATVEAVAPHDSVERYAGLGVEVILGEAKIVSPWEVAVTANGETRTLSSRAIVLATGARPFVPPIPGIEETGYLTSDTLWDLRALPERLLVLGGGPIGCELAQCFARLGARVTIAEMQPRLLLREDVEVSEFVARRFLEEGVDLRLNHIARRFLVEDGEKTLLAEHAGQEVRIPFDAVLVAVGRKANTRGFGLEELGIAVAPSGFIEANEFSQTAYPNIFVCGDAAGPLQFTHAAAHQAWCAAVNALLGGVKKFRADASVIPWTIFTDPEVARAGLNEQEARAANLAYEVVRYDLADLDRAIAEGETGGFVKVLTAPGRDRILGVTSVGAHAGETVAEFVLAMRHGLGLNKVLSAVHCYPTFAEANKYAAGAWKRAHVSPSLLRLAERYHAWRRGE
jgi:pyruvate/2-oxoglutarate dehydrogenase complex dihydrolipoamide dehydrogenase (E3) component/uncharacterized membrane protein YdjX (TVP38/TMEM64 family)